MKSIVQFFLPHKFLVLFMFAVSIFRGLVFPDLSYGYTSIFAIGVVYPLLLLAPLFLSKEFKISYIQYLLLGVFCITLSVVIGYIKYSLDYQGAKEDVVAMALAFLSLFVIIFVYIVVLSFWFKLRNR